jgi:hypothetical protein
MPVSTATGARHRFEDALRTLNEFVAFANHERTEAPSVAGLSQDAAALLRRPSGRSVVKTWTLVFDDTIRLVNDFNPKDEKETEEVTAAVLRATDALRQRLDSLGRGLPR